MPALFDKVVQQIALRKYELLLLLVVVLSACMRYGLVGVPLERDEGEYAYAGQLILQGIPPYEELYTMKLPGTNLVYAGIMALCGQTHEGIHVGLIAFNILIIITMYYLTKQVVDSLAGIIAAASFAILSMGQSIQGIYANTEHFVIFFALTGIILLLYALERQKAWLVFLSGLLLGSGILMKQHGMAFIAFALLYLFTHEFLAPYRKGWRNGLFLVAVLSIGAILPYLITCLVFIYLGLFDKFWFWTVTYALTYTSTIPMDLAWEGFKESAKGIFTAAPLIWVLAFIGLASLAWDERARNRSLFIGGFALFSFLSILPGFYFRPHYFILILPAAALLSGLAVSSMAGKLPSGGSWIQRGIIPGLIVIIGILISVFQQKQFLFEMTPTQISRATYGLNPFPESLEIARFIKDNTTENDRIAIIGSEPQIYFYSSRRAATGNIYMYPLMEKHDYALEMQKEMIREIEYTRPKYLVYVHIQTSWLAQRDSHKLIFNWLEQYLDRYYTIAGVVNISMDKTEYLWSPDIQAPPDSPAWIAVFKKR